MTLTRFSLLVIEDEPDIQKALIDKLDSTNYFTVIGAADSVETAFQGVLSKKPDAIFLDIKLIGGNAFQLLDKLKNNKVDVPPVIINTGFAEFDFAQRIFNDYQDCVVMILKKPFWEDWESKLEKCYDAVMTKLSLANHPPAQQLNDSYLQLRSGNQTYRIDPADICFIEVGGGGSTFIIMHEDQIQVNWTMSQLLRKMPAYIQQISRFISVNTNCIHHLDHENHHLYLHKREKGFQIGQSYYQKLKDLFG